jgi:hypothetical protein
MFPEKFDEFSTTEMGVIMVKVGVRSQESGVRSQEGSRVGV